MTNAGERLCHLAFKSVRHLLRNRHWEARRQVAINFAELDPDKELTHHREHGDRTKLLPYTNFYVEVLTQFRIKLLHVEVLTNFRIKLLHVEVLAIFPDKTSTLTKLIKKIPPPRILKSPTIKTGFKILKTSSVQPVSVHLFEVVIWKTTIDLIQGKSHFPFLFQW